MTSNPLLKQIAVIYLALVPFIVALIGFGLGHSRVSIYLPVWMIHCCLMLTAITLLGIPAPGNMTKEKKQLLITALFLVLPWMFMAIFAGMGPPPRVPSEWVNTTVEQEIRYTILLAAGISMALGLALLREKLRQAGESFYSQLGFAAMMIAIPFFIINMTYLGSMLATVLPHFPDKQPGGRPEWYMALRAQFVPESAVQVSVTYIASAAFAISMKNISWIKKSSANTYLGFSIAGFILSLMPSSLPDAIEIPSFVVSVPAITFIMPYLFGIQLMRRTGR